MKYRALVLLVALPLLLVGVSHYVLYAYYERYEKIARYISTSYDCDASTANAIKHATAAADIYNLLSPVVGEEYAENTVIKLGVMNEYIERVMRPEGKYDSPREIMKDLHNNYAGIKAAKLADGNDAFRIILAFASNRTLIVNEIYNPFFDDKGPDQNVVAFGYDWFKLHHGEIDSRIQMKIARANDSEIVHRMEVSNFSWKSPTFQ